MNPQCIVFIAFHLPKNVCKDALFHFHILYKKLHLLLEIFTKNALKGFYVCYIYMYVLPHHYISHVNLFLVDNLSTNEKPKNSKTAQFLRFNIKNCTYSMFSGLLLFLWCLEVWLRFEYRTLILALRPKLKVYNQWKKSLSKGPVNNLENFQAPKDFFYKFQFI